MKRNCSPSSSNALRSRPPSRKDCAPEGVGAAVRTAAPAVAAASRATQHRILVPPTQQTRKQSTDMSTELGSRTHPHTDGSRLPGATRGGRHACLAGRYTTGRTRPSCQVVCHTAVPSPPRSVPVHSPRNPSMATHVAVPRQSFSENRGAILSFPPAVGSDLWCEAARPRPQVAADIFHLLAVTGLAPQAAKVSPVGPPAETH